MMDFELNKPLTYLSKFKKLIEDNGWYLDLFWARDYSNGAGPPIEDKIKDAKFLVIRKPLTFLSGPKVRKTLQDAVIKDEKSILIMYTFSESDSLHALNKFMEPFKIQLSDASIIDMKTNQDDKHNVVFQKKNRCFFNDSLFKGVSKLLIPFPHHIYTDDPAKILIRANPSSELKFDIFQETKDIKGTDLIVGAYYDKTGRIVVVDSTLFLDNYFDFNKRFVKNVFTWLYQNK